MKKLTFLVLITVCALLIARKIAPNKKSAEVPELSAVDYQNSRYRVLKAVSNLKTNQIAYLTTKDVSNYCSVFNQTTCTIFLVDRGEAPQKIADVTELNANSFFAWDEEDPVKIIFQRQFSEGTATFSAVESVNLESGEIKELIRLNTQALTTPPAEVSKNYPGEQICFDGYSQVVRKGGKELEFFSCYDEDLKLIGQFLTFENQTLKKFTEHAKDAFSLDLTKNISSETQLEFTVQDKSYKLNLENGFLTEL